MKKLQIDETETQLVINIEGSTVAHVAMKDDAENIRETLLAVLAEAPVVKESEPEPKEKSVLSQAADALDGDDDDIGIEEAARTVFGALEEIAKSPEVQKAKSFFERLPKSKRHRREHG